MLPEYRHWAERVHRGDLVTFRNERSRTSAVARFIEFPEPFAIIGVVCVPHLDVLLFVSESSSPDAVRLYEKSLAKDGYVPNYIRLWAHRPDVYEALVETRTIAATGSSLSEKDVSLINAAAAGARRDAYCSLAWGARVANLFDPDVASAVVTGSDDATLTPRERALVAWARSLVSRTDLNEARVEQLRLSGLSDREIFDATFLAALRIAFCTVNSALAAEPDEQLRVSWSRLVGNA